MSNVNKRIAVDDKEEKTDGRKRNGRSERKATGGGSEPVESIPGWQKARDAVRQKHQDAKQSKKDGERDIKASKAPTHTKMGMTVGGIKNRDRVQTSFTSKLHTFSKPRQKSQFGSPKPKSA